MTRSAKSVLRSASVLVLAGLMLAGCASSNRKASPKPVSGAPAPVETITPAKPTVSKGDPDLRFKEALKLMKDRQAKDAYDALLLLAKDFPEFSGPLTDLAILQSNSKQRAPAIINFQKAIKNNPQNAIAQNWLGSLQREAGDLSAAEAAYRAALAIKSDYAAPHLNLGILYDAYLKRPQDALNEYREYQRLAGTDKLIVSAWIHELQDRMPPPAPVAAPVPAAPEPTAKPVEHK